MYINEKGFDSLVETYVELSICVNHLEKYLRRLEICLDNLAICRKNIEKDNKEDVKEESPSVCNKCNDCTCDEEKEKPKRELN